MTDASSERTPGAPMNTAASARRGMPAQQSPTGASSLETPGLVTFAAIMLGLLGGFQIIWAITEFANAAWFSSVTYGNFGGHLWLWAILDLVLGFVSLYAGYSLIIGGRFGQVYGLIVAGISAFRWFFYLPAAPWAGIVMLVVDVLIIYGLVVHRDYFNANGQTTLG